MASQGLNTEGVRLHQQGNYQAASQKFIQAIANDPQNPDAYYNLAANYHRQGKMTGNQADLVQAEGLYNQCLDRDGNHPDCYRGLAVLLAETGRSDASLRLLEGWKTRSPANPEAKIELARFMDELGNKDAAQDYLLAALAIDPNNPRALTALGRLREEGGDHLQALANYERSLSSNRFQPQVATRVAALQTALGGTTTLNSPGATRMANEPLNWSRY